MGGTHRLHRCLGRFDGDGLERGLLLLLCEGGKGNGCEQGTQGTQGRREWVAAMDAQAGVGVGGHVCEMSMTYAKQAQAIRSPQRHAPMWHPYLRKS
jgi:hypothetical protein